MRETPPGVFMNHKITFDYENQAWIVDGHYVRCGHPEQLGCDCYGKQHEGEPAEKAENI